MKIMLKSDNNGAYIVDKKLFWLIGFILTALLSIVSVVGSNALSSIEDGSKLNASQEARIVIIEKQLDRIENKLDKALSVK